MSQVKKFTKSKGYESLDRNMLQDVDNLSIEAIGLLAHLTSYPNNWELHKTELYTRFAKSKKSKIMTAWNELVKERYICQFIRRTGRAYEYIYYHSQERFTIEEIETIAKDEKANIWDGSKITSKKTEPQKSEKPKNQNAEKPDSEGNISNAENQHPKTSEISNADFQHPKLSIPNSAPNKELDYKKVYQEKKEEEEEAYNAAISFFEENIIKANGAAQKGFKKWITLLPLEVILNEIEFVAKQGAKSFAYLEKALIESLAYEVDSIEKLEQKRNEHTKKNKVSSQRKSVKTKDEKVPEWFAKYKEQRKSASTDQVIEDDLSPEDELKKQELLRKLGVLKS